MKNQARYSKQADKLIFVGVLLFFLGLVVGLFAPVLASPRLGLSSHIEGVVNGIFLIVLGLIWHKVTLSARWLNFTFWLAIYGTFANWLAILIAAFFNTGDEFSVITHDSNGTEAAENSETFFLLSLSIAMIIICINVLIGLRRNMKQENH